LKNKTGTCRICGKHTTLTFEHIPPKVAFNHSPVRTFNGESIAKNEGGKKIKYKINQRGSGDYVLCRNCNSYNGLWYVPEYAKIAKELGYVILQNKDLNEGDIITIKFQDVTPLAFIKAIISIICCTIDYKTVKKFRFDEFLLDKELNNLDFLDYDIEIYALSNYSVTHDTGVTVLGKKDIYGSYYSEVVAEAAYFPIGVIFHIRPEKAIDYGISLKNFKDLDYEKYDLKMSIPFHKNPYHPLVKILKIKC
jgi:hypothetical protein